MTTNTQRPAASNELARERERIRAAAARPLAGQPIHSTGALTVVQLAAETQAKRWRLTHQLLDLMQEFQSAVVQTTDKSPAVARWREQNHTLRGQVDEL